MRLCGPCFGEYSFVTESGDTRKLFPGQKLQRRAAAGRDVSDAFGDAGLSDRSYRIAAADNYNRAAIRGLGHRVRDADRSLIERRFFEYSHRAVPDDRFRVTKSIREVRHGLCADIHSRVAGVGKFDRNSFSQNLLGFDWFVTVNDLMIRWQQQLNLRRLATVLDLQSQFEPIILDQRLPYRKPFRLQKSVSHRAADQQLIDFAIDERIDDGNLVGNFRAAENRNERMRRIVD